jgi:hypothetical protein
MRVIKAPKTISYTEPNSVFLAGSIEMGAAENWQDRVIKDLSDIENLVILNPRRDDWDSSWIEEKTNLKFKEQVVWEQTGLASVDIVIFYFDPNTKSPITLLEFGQVSEMYKDAVVYCPKGFWRKGNVDIVAERSHMISVDNYEDLIKHVRMLIME